MNNTYWTKKKSLTIKKCPNPHCGTYTILVVNKSRSKREYLLRNRQQIRRGEKLRIIQRDQNQKMLCNRSKKKTKKEAKILVNFGTNTVNMANAGSKI